MTERPIAVRFDPRTIPVDIFDMDSTPPMRFNDLLESFDLVSAQPMGTSAYVARCTGRRQGSGLGAEEVLTGVLQSFCQGRARAAWPYDWRNTLCIDKS